VSTDSVSITELAEYMINDLCCLQYTFIRPKYVTLLQVCHLYDNDKTEFEQNLKLAIEQTHFSKKSC